MNHDRKPRLRVLVVDDDPLIRWSVGETLVTAGHSVVGASDGTSAVCVVGGATEPIDVVLLDYHLPDSNDLGLLALIRRLLPRSAVLLITAFGTPEIIRDALQLGADRVVDKPFDVHALEPMLLQAHASLH
jgi:DNA-binding NtrC family response regulator